MEVNPGLTAIQHYPDKEAALDLEGISQRLKQGDSSAEELSAFQIYLAGEYGVIILRLIKLLELKAEYLPQFQAKYATFAEADKRWDLTDAGVRERAYQLQMRLIEQQLQAIDRRLKMLSIKSVVNDGHF